MASVYTNLKKGSSGNEVSALQTALNKKGYALQTTGLYDDATEAAVRQYQQDNNLTADGVAGDITLGALYGTNANTGGYTPSTQLTEAQKYVESVAAQKPAEYQSAYTQQMQAQFEAIMNRQPFSYDVGSDASFKQMQDMYTQQGRMAMMDTMGKAAEMTGGYGNSYAQGAGQAAYNQYLQQLYTMAPEYEQKALTRYQQEGADMLDRYNMMAAREENEYGRYMDRVNQYYNDLDRAQQEADKLYNREYGEYQDKLSWQQMQDELAWQKQQHQENLALDREKYESSLAWDREQYESSLAWDREQYENSLAWDREQHQGKLDSENREYAYNTALMLLQGGQMPSADLLAMAGISAADAELIMAMYKPKSSGNGKQPTEKDKLNLMAGSLAAVVAANKMLAAKTTGNGSEILSYQEWNSKNLAPDAKNVTDATSAKNKEEYETYVADTIEKDFKTGKISAVEAMQLTAKYLTNK